MNKIHEFEQRDKRTTLSRPLIEQFLWRGYCCQKFANKDGPYPSIIIIYSYEHQENSEVLGQKTNPKPNQLKKLTEE